jgi:hypothetical protein
MADTAISDEDHENWWVFFHQERERRARIKTWRAARIQRFADNQRRRRQWINFAEIVEWHSDEGLVSNNEKLVSAFKSLATDLLLGDFETNERSRVLYLHPNSGNARMTREWMRRIEDIVDADTRQSEYLAHCWIESAMFKRWLSKHGLPESPARFNALIPAQNMLTPARYAGRPTLQPAIEEERARRAKAAITLPTLSKEADCLLQWVRDRFPGEPGLPKEKKTIENQIRVAYRSSKAPK